MGSKTRRYFTAEKKAQIVRRHLADKIEISDLADEFEVQPSQIQTWIKQVLDQAERALERSGAPRRTDKAKDHKIAQLEEKLTTKNEVIAEPTGSIAGTAASNGSVFDRPRSNRSRRHAEKWLTTSSITIIPDFTVDCPTFFPSGLAPTR